MSQDELNSISFQGEKNQKSVTPWEVSNNVNYDSIITDFGVSKISSSLVKEIESLSEGKNLKYLFLLRRGFFYAHRDLDRFVSSYKKGENVALYTGRGPSGDIQLGHVIVWLFTRDLMKLFNSKMFFQLTDDEKFLFKDLSFEKINYYTKSNLKDINAFGFDKTNTEFILDSEDIKKIYKTALSISKKINFSNVKAIFGFRNDSSIGQIFMPSLEIAPAFYAQQKGFENVLIPCAIDQDPFFRLARDIASKLNYNKPSTFYSKFLPSLSGDAKMSSSVKSGAIYLSDSQKEIKKKVMKAVTGGRETLEEQKKLGGQPNKCPVYDYYKYFFESDDSKLKERFDECKSGKLLCGTCKGELAKRIQRFIKSHQDKINE